jgi:phosphoglycolate phosphatase
MPGRSTGHDGIIFDLDGTLWDSTSACADAWNFVLRELDVSDRVFTSKDIEKVMGMTLEQIFSVSFPEKDEETRKKLAKECFEKEIEVISKTGVAVYPGVKVGLRSLAEHFPLFIVSNCSPSYLRTFFEVTGLQTHFKDSECHGATKLPKSENIKLVVQRNQLKSAAYIGDTASDEQAANLAGVSFYHAAYGFGLPLKPCVQFKSFSEIVPHFVGDQPCV